MKQHKAPNTIPAQAECIYDQEINTLVANLSDDAHCIAALEDKVSRLIVFCILLASVAFGLSLFALEQYDQRIKRLERLQGIDELGKRR